MAVRATDDLDLNEFLAATREFCDLMRKFGSFVSPSVANVRMCLLKIERACDELAAADGPRRHWGRRRSLQSMKALLKAEAEAGVHGKGGVLADPSAAIGLLWVRRGLLFWARVFELEAERLGRGPEARGSEAGVLKAQSDAAYDEVLSPVHGWVSRRGYKLAMSRCPEWSDARQRAGLPECDEALRADFAAWAKAMRKLAKCMTKLHVNLDLEDKRRSV